MRKYVLICNNRRKKILYYYDFRDECVYCIDGGETSKNAEKGARKGGYYGGIIGIFFVSSTWKSKLSFAEWNVSLHKCVNGAGSRNLGCELFIKLYRKTFFKGKCIETFCK